MSTPAERTTKYRRGLVPLRLEITSIAPGGAGLAHVQREDGRRAVFVARAAPGDVLEAEVDFSEKPARATVLRVLQASPSRAEMPCSFADRCGGCDLMHLTAEAQLEAHRAIVVAALGRALRGSSATPGAELPAVVAHPAPRALAYRSRARLAVLARQDHVRLGYRRIESRIIENVSSCIVLDPRLDAMLPALRELFSRERGEGEISVALGSQGRPVLDLRWAGELSGSFFAGLSGKIVEDGAWAGAEVWLEGARQPARVGDARGVTLGADGQDLIVPSGGFAQAHPAMNQKLGARLLAVAAPEGQSLVELFAGSGNFTVLLARHAASLLAVESEPRAVLAARENLRARALSARVVEGDANTFELPPGTRSVVLDPPRAGSIGAATRLAGSKARRVVYVSCDPSTLARDVAILAAAGFRLSAVEVFEMFPQTSHVEVLVLLERPGSTHPATATVRT